MSPISGSFRALCYATCATAALVTSGIRSPLPSRSERAAVSAKLIIWPRQPNSMTGARMTVVIDAQSAQTISNLTEQQMIDLGSLTPGVHAFSLGSITGYMVDQNGGTQQASSGNATCAGQFLVSPYQTYYALMVASQDGVTFQCQIR